MNITLEKKTSLTPKINMRRACAAGALTCLNIGARRALPTRQSVDALSRA